MFCHELGLIVFIENEMFHVNRVNTEVEGAITNCALSAGQRLKAVANLLLSAKAAPFPPLLPFPTLIKALKWLPCHSTLICGHPALINPPAPTPLPTTGPTPAHPSAQLNPPHLTLLTPGCCINPAQTPGPASRMHPLACTPTCEHPQ